jgi:large subunit ribosomal protein L4
MPEAKILGGTSTATLDDVVFGARFNGPLVHESVRAELAARRQGTHSTKTRGNVRGGGAKPWRQKGTGRARAGSSRSPIWTGGGIVFGPQPRHYTFKVNRKERRAALRSALSIHAERESLAVFDAGTGFDSPSTKAAAKLLGDWLGKGHGSVLVILGDAEDQVALSFRNVDRVSVLPASAAGIADVVGASALLLSQAAADALTDRAKGGS